MKCLAHKKRLRPDLGRNLSTCLQKFQCCGFAWLQVLCVVVYQLCHDLFFSPFTDEVDNPCHGKKQDASDKKQDADCSVCCRPARPEEFRFHKVATERQKPQFPEDADNDGQTKQDKRNDQELVSDDKE